MKKINNKWLIVGLASLVGIFVLSRVFRSPKMESNLRKELVTLDTTKVTEVRIVPKGDPTQLIKLIKTADRWAVTQGDKTFDADPSAAKGLMATLTTLQAQRMVGRKKDKWETFNVGEKATNVSVYYGSDKEADFHVGNTGFNQPPGGGNPQFGGGGFSAYTYVRLSDEEEVYSVDGFLESSFNRGLQEWRDKSFLRIPRDLVTRIAFTYPADSSFVLEKKDTLWYAAGRQADKSIVDNYLSQLVRKNLSTIVDDNKSGINPDVTLQIDGAGGSIGKVEAWKGESWVLKSSLQPTVYFSSQGSSIDKDLFVTSRKFIKD